MDIDKIKVAITAVMGLLSSLLGILFIPVGMLVICNIIDYATGLMATPVRKEKINSYKSIRGITKKISMWFLVVVGAIVDELILFSSQTIGLIVPFSFAIACVVAIWLICNELISILENIGDIGVALPPFLNKLVYYIKEQAEEKADIGTDKKESEDKK